MKNSLYFFAATALLAAWYLQTVSRAAVTDSRPAPEFPRQEAGRWINSKPLKMAGNGENGLRGKVVLLNVWTFM